MKKDKDNKEIKEIKEDIDLNKVDDYVEEDEVGKNSKYYFPVGALIAIGVIVVLMIACIIVICNL